MSIINKTFELHVGHRLPNHDGHCARLHGHTYKVEVMLGGMVNTDESSPKFGMVIDFGDVKEAWKAVHNEMDHHMILWDKDPIVYDLKVARSVTTNVDIDELGDIWTEYLKENGIVLVPSAPTAEYFAETLFSNLFPHFLPLGAVLLGVRVWETPTSWAMADGQSYDVSVIMPDAEEALPN
jgi:6-pyruvoyltetrahydropterin/6-carboxytetrahydropterin synthase